MSDMKSLPVIVDRQAPSCKHFTDLQSGKCALGITYESVRKDHEPIEYAHHPAAKPPYYKHSRSFPCMGKYNLGGAVCDKLELPTSEEIAAEEAEYKRLSENTRTAREAIVKFLGGPWKKGKGGASGEITCPVCESGTLKFSRSGYNGHIHATCTTDGCVAWME